MIIIVIAFPITPKAKAYSLYLVSVFGWQGCVDIFDQLPEVVLIPVRPRTQVRITSSTLFLRRIILDTTY